MHNHPNPPFSNPNPFHSQPFTSISIPLHHLPSKSQGSSYHQSFDEMPHRNSPFSFHSSLILAKTKQGNYYQAFDLFTEMLKSGWRPDEFALASLLKASSYLKDASLGEQLHLKSIRSGLASEPGVRASLIYMYSNNGLLVEARSAFDELALVNGVDVPSWNSTISAYAYHGWYDECFSLFATMLGEAKLTPTDATYTIVVHTCSLSGNVEMGKMVHTMIVKDQIHDEIKMLKSLITMYAKCGHLEDARKAFEEMDGLNVVSWNAMISGFVHVQNEECRNAIDLFRAMVRSKGQRVPQPNRITFLSVLGAISSLSALKLGTELHAQLIKYGLECEMSLCNSIITMYGKCGDMVKARLFFEKISSRDIISWNSLLVGYEQNKQVRSCFNLFKEMQVIGVQPDVHTLIILVNGLSLNLLGSDSWMLGRAIHGYILKRTLAKALQILAYNAILNMYTKNDKLGETEKFFKEMSERDSYSWKAMIEGYSMNDLYEDAIKLFNNMLEQGFSSNHVICSILLTACSKLASIELGKQFHASAVKHFLHLTNSHTILSVNNALISMYSKCGSIRNAEELFQRMERKDVFSWTAMITGYAQHGMAYESIHMFEEMKRNDVLANSVTFLGLLTACAHAGLVKQGMHYFTLMSEEFALEPSFEHFACMVDLFSRSGQFERAEATIHAGISCLGKNHNSCLNLWKVLLGACHTYNQLDLGVRAATMILELEPDDEATHVLLSNLFASSGLWHDAVAVRKSMREKGLKKEAGCSWVEIGKQRHVFVSGDD